MLNEKDILKVSWLGMFEWCLPGCQGLFLQWHFFQHCCNVFAGHWVIWGKCRKAFTTVVWATEAQLWNYGLRTYLSCHGCLIWTKQAVCEENVKTTKNADLIRQRVVLLFVLQLVYQKPLSNPMCGLCQLDRGRRRTAQRGEQYKCLEDVPVFISSFPRTNSFSCIQCCCSMFSDDWDFLNEESGKYTRSWKLCRASCSLHDGAGSGLVRPLGAGHKCRDGSIEKKALVLVLFIIMLYVLDQVFSATVLIVCRY